MRERFALLELLASVIVGGYALIRLWRVRHRQSPRLAYAAIVSFVGVALSLSALRLGGTYLATAVLVPLIIFALTQIPLTVFENRKDAIRPAALLIAAVVLQMVSGLGGTKQTSTWWDSAVFLMQFIGIVPLIAAYYLLFRAGWAVKAWWGVGLNPVTVAAVLPAFVQTHPKDGWVPARRFLFWLGFTFGPEVIDAALAGREPLFAVGYLLFTIGGLAAMGAFVWILGTVLRRRWWSLARPVLTLAVSAAVAVAGMLMFGDLVFRRDAWAVAGRTLGDRALGCTGNRRHAALLMALSKRPLPPQLKPVAVRAGELAERGTHDPAVAYLLAQASTLVYMGPCSILRTTEEWGDSRLRVVPVGSSSPVKSADGECHDSPGRDQAVILAHDDAIVVAFRGTNQFANWATNLSFVPRTLLQQQWTHRGFEDAFERLSEPLLGALQEVRNNNQSVWLTGHSLGGALAILAAERFERAGIPVEAVYTFGQPRAVSEAVATKLNERFPAYFRFVMHGDAVPNLGTPGAIHAGKLRYIDTLGKLHSSVSFKVSTMDSLCAGPFRPIESHGMTHYLDTMQIMLIEAAERAGRIPAVVTSARW